MSLSRTVQLCAFISVVVGGFHRILTQAAEPAEPARSEVYFAESDSPVLELPALSNAPFAEVSSAPSNRPGSGPVFGVGSELSLESLTDEVLARNPSLQAMTSALQGAPQ